MKKGKVYLIGAGPAGKDLITARGLEILREAEVVVYDYLVDKELLQEVPPDAELIYCGHSARHVESTNVLVVNRAKAGKKVVRLKNGDPFIFGRAAEEITALLKNQIEYEVVPGVTAASAAAAYSGIPLTDRKLSSSVVLVTGHEAAGKKLSAVDWKGLAAAGTIVLYMAVENIARIVGKLFEAGKSPETPAAAIYRAGSFSQQIVNARLKELPAAIKAKGIRAPAIIIIGKTVKLGKQFNWLRKNKRILFTGLSQKRSFLKGNYFHLPLVKIVPLDNYRRFDNYLLYIRQFDWLVFASRYGVEYFFKRLNYVGLDSRFLRGMKIAAVGASTARRLRDYGIIADLAPKEESSAGLLKVFAKMDMKYKKIFLPRSNLADKGLTEGFKNLGCQVTSVVAYKNVMPAHLPDINLESFNEIMFTSPSTVRNFLKQYGRPPKAVKISCIGAVTRQQALKLRLLRKTS